MEEISKNRIAGIAGTIGIHILVAVLLLFYVLIPTSDHRWTEPLEGVPVMYGNVPDAFGDNEPFGKGDNTKTENDDNNIIDETSAQITTHQQPIVSTTALDDNAIATQDFEESVAIKSAEKIKQEEAARQAALEAEQKQNIENQMAGLFGNGSGDGNRGETSGTGTQGVSTGNASHGRTSGIGGWGSYDLGGRGVGSGGLVKPSYTANDYGTVVVDIIVDPQGNVVNATLGRGTNTTSTSLKNEALRAARSTKFNSVNKQGNQTGTISYKFNLN